MVIHLIFSTPSPLNPHCTILETLVSVLEISLIFLYYITQIYVVLVK